MRILGILQKMSICYGIVLFFHWFSDYGRNHLKRRIGAVFMIILVLIYIPLMANWKIVSSINAVLTIYMGYVFGMVLAYYKNDMKMLIRSWLIIAFLCFLPIYPSSLLFPFNKKLYTITFLFTVLATSMTVLTLFMVILDFAVA